jgi:hypothetical protein
MSFGATIRELLTASYCVDLHGARATRTLPEAGESGALDDLAAHLQRTFGIEVSTDELERLGTVRDVLQCVRLHLWERRVGLAAGGADAAATPDTDAAAADVESAADHPVAFAADDLRRRFRRYAPTSAHLPAPSADARAKRL